MVILWWSYYLDRRQVKQCFECSYIFSLKFYVILFNKFSSLIINWGITDSRTNPTLVNFPTSFNFALPERIPINLTTQSGSNSVFSATVQHHSKTNSSFTLTATYNGINTACIAIGY